MDCGAALFSLLETIEQSMLRIVDLDLWEFPRVDLLFNEVNDSLHFFRNLETSSSSSRKRIVELTLMDRVYNQFNSLRDFFSLRIMKRGQVNFPRDLNASYEEEIRGAAYKMEDVLEFHLPSDRNENLLADFREVEQEILSFIGKIKEIKKKYSETSSCNSALDDQVVVSSAAYPSTTTTNFFDGSSNVGEELVGLHDEYVELKCRVLSKDRRQRLLPITILGMAGIGKTTLAKAVCEDPEVWSSFNYHLYVPVGPNGLLKQVLLCILAQLNHEERDDDDTLFNHSEKKLAKRVKKILNRKSYIMLLDDVWKEDVWIDLKRILPYNSSGSRVIMTTRLVPIARKDAKPYNIPHEKQFLSKEESWELLRKKVFHSDRCPYKLQKLGEKIAEKCDGLPLAIISVGNHLAKADKIIEYWKYVAEKGIASIIGADDGLMKVLHPSYEHLHSFFKALFLYLGVFPQYHEVVASKIIKLWIAEGLVKQSLSNDEGKAVEMGLQLIKENNLIIAKHLSSEKIKTCRLHIVYWQYCKTQAPKEKFFQILHTLDDCLVEGIHSQRRLCIHNNSLFGIKDAFQSIESISNARSLLCTGPYHRYPVPICFGLRLLRVFEAVSIRFFEFPLEVLKLTRLRYIAITYDGDIPASISQLINLWYLIVHRHHRIISSKCPSYLPKEIWYMKELIHLQVMGSDLTEPPHGVLLKNLLKLLDVSPLSCTKQILESIPNLKKLGVQIVLPVDPKENNRLVSLKCNVVNPKPSSLVAARAYPTSVFPKGLRKLSLSGFGYSWDQMSEISSSSPKLDKLKLRHCAFQGSIWVVKREFRRLKFVLLEDLDLRYWDVDSVSFVKIKHLAIRHCYKLEQIPLEIRVRLPGLAIVDCKPSVADAAKEHERSLQTKFAPFFDVSVVSSWDD